MSLEVKTFGDNNLIRLMSNNREYEIVRETSKALSLMEDRGRGLKNRFYWIPKRSVDVVQRLEHPDVIVYEIELPYWLRDKMGVR